MTPEAAALAFRRRVIAADAQFADALVALMAPLRARYERNHTPRPDLLRAARRTWINDFPTFGCLDGPTPDLHGTRLSIRETRLCAGRVDPARWATVPGGDPFAEAPEHQPGIALLANALAVAPGVLRFRVSIFALVSLVALAEWCAARPEVLLVTDLATLAAVAARLTEADAGRRFRCAGWEGVVVHSPEAAGDGPPKVMAVVGTFMGMREVVP